MIAIATNDDLAATKLGNAGIVRELTFGTTKIACL